MADMETCGREFCGGEIGIPEICPSCGDRLLPPENGGGETLDWLWANSGCWETRRDLEGAE